MYLDLDELDAVFARRWFWSARRSAPFRFHRGDHFGARGESLADSVRREIRAQTGEHFSGSIRLLTQIRHFGFVFNPVSFYYCFAQPEAAQPDFILAEVNNTPWGQRHCYVLHPDQFARKLTAAQPVAKVFHVSPFMDLAMEYAWHLPTPGQRLSADILNRREGRAIFDVTMQLERRELTNFNLLRTACSFPFSTFRVFAQIYWQALRLWWKRVPFVPHPAKGQPHGNQGIGTGSVKTTRGSRGELSSAKGMREIVSQPHSRPAHSAEPKSTEKSQTRPPANVS